VWLTKHMRTIRLPELLIKFDNDLRFTDHIVPPAQRGGRDADDGCTLLSVVLAHGCNIGLHTISQITQGVTYKQLKRASDWQMTAEVQRAALAALVNAISRLDTTLHWGEGRTSASDGQRFAMPRKVLQQTYSTRFSDLPLEFYSSIADNYAPYYSMSIECTDRDSAFVLDGLLYNESDLAREEHYSDTHGYTEINFAAFAIATRVSPLLDLYRRSVAAIAYFVHSTNQSGPVSRSEAVLRAYFRRNVGGSLFPALSQSQTAARSSDRQLVSTRC
jgi:hypothetical protein